jgi:transposase
MWIQITAAGGRPFRCRSATDALRYMRGVANWLADLLAHGLVRAVERMRSAVPDASTQAMRALRRTRKQLVREQASHVQRLQKTLEDANLKLASVLTDIMGLSGRASLEALIAGETAPDRLLALVHRRVKADPAQLRAALSGRVGNSHRFLLRLHLGQVRRRWRRRSGRLMRVRSPAANERNLAPCREAVRLLRAVPGVGDLAARALVAEIGRDLRRFPTPPIWCPGQASVPATTRARASAAPPACARAHLG